MPLQIVNPVSIDSEFFEVQGAGKIQVGDSAECECGTAIGFHVGVEWGQWGYAGGVMDAKEAKRLADFIYDRLQHQDIKIIEVNDETNKN